MIEAVAIFPIAVILAALWASNRSGDRLEEQWMARTKPRAFKRKR
jgi:hypothetical protein